MGPYNWFRRTWLIWMKGFLCWVSYAFSTITALNWIPLCFDSALTLFIQTKLYMFNSNQITYKQYTAEDLKSSHKVEFIFQVGGQLANYYSYFHVLLYLFTTGTITHTIHHILLCSNEMHRWSSLYHTILAIINFMDMWSSKVMQCGMKIAANWLLTVGKSIMNSFK